MECLSLHLVILFTSFNLLYVDYITIILGLARVHRHTHRIPKKAKKIYIL